MPTHSSRQYRPQTFAAILGQEPIVTTLKNGLKLGRIANAYLFSGPRGTGKTTLARVFAKALNCPHRTPDFEPCTECPSCQEIAGSRALDVLEIDGASNRGIDDIRELNESAYYTPHRDKYKIYIIDEVHMLTKEAFNALLKTLEEPPPNVLFLFATTEPHKVLPTILSRCQRFDLRRMPQAVIVQKLELIAKETEVRYERGALELIANLAEGGLRDAEALFDQLVNYGDKEITEEAVRSSLGLSPKVYFTRLDDAFTRGDTTVAFTLAEELFSSGRDFSHFLGGLIEHYREALVGSKPPYTQEQCLYLLDFLIAWQEKLTRLPFKRIILETILLHIIRSKARVSVEKLVRRLEEVGVAKGIEAKVVDVEVGVTREIEAKAVDVEVVVAKGIEAEKLTQRRKDAKEEEVRIEAPMPPLPTPPAKSEPKKATPPQRVETLLRFAAVELEGTLKR